MKSNFNEYNLFESIKRIDEILGASNSSFEELKYVPTRDKLSFINGFYVDCTALFVDIRGSSELPNKHTRPALAKIYRAYISELVAIMNGNSNCREINIHGDSVWGVFDTCKKVDVDEVFGVAANIASLVDVINYKLRQKNFEELTVGVGMDYGRALMIKSGYNGSGINEVVWMGDVVNYASELCGYGNRNWDDSEIMVSDVLYSNLNDHNKSLLFWNDERRCYHGDVINTGINSWLKKKTNQQI